MMTISLAHPKKSGGVWALWVALIGSLLVHTALFVGGTFGYGLVAHASDSAVALSSNTLETVTVSHPFVLEHRTAAAPPSTVLPIANSAVKVRVAAPSGFHFPSSGLPRRVFSGAVAGSGQRGLSPTQIAFAKALARNAARQSATPARVDDPARVPEKYRLTMQGRNAKLERGQGIYFPTRGWRENGLDYYDVSYDFVDASGVEEKGAVPWPIHFDPGSDPFFSPNFSALSKTPLPSPPPGFVPPGDLGKALRAYFPNLRFEDSDPPN